jgi:hypothetical protein
MATVATSCEHSVRVDNKTRLTSALCRASDGVALKSLLQNIDLPARIARWQ